MKGHTVPWIDGVRDSLTDLEQRRVYLQEAVRALLSEDPDDSAVTLHLFFRATCGYSAAGEAIGVSGEQLEAALHDGSVLTLQQFGRLIQFALQQNGLQVAHDLLSFSNTAGPAMQQQAA